MSMARKVMFCERLEIESYKIRVAMEVVNPWYEYWKEDIAQACNSNGGFSIFDVTGYYYLSNCILESYTVA